MSLLINENNKKRNNNDIDNIKEKIKIQIKTLNDDIKSLEKTLKIKKLQLLEIQLENDKNSYKNKLLTLKEQYNFVVLKYIKKIQTLKKKVIVCEKKFISKDIFEENLYKEDLNFQNDKLKTLDELVEYRRLLSDSNLNEENKEECTNIIQNNTSNEETIKEGSFMSFSKPDSLNDKTSFFDEIMINDIKNINIAKKMYNFQK